MARFLLISFMLLLNGLVLGCNVYAQEVRAPKIEFPDNIGQFTKVDLQEYDDPSFGYGVKFLTDDQSGAMDVYVFPVDNPVAHLPHDELVQGYLIETQRGITEAVKAGVYIRSENSGVSSFKAGETIILKSRHLIVSPRGKLLSIAYVTERGGTVIKLRVSVPDSIEANLLEEFESSALRLIEVALNALLEMRPDKTPKFDTATPHD